MIKGADPGIFNPSNFSEPYNAAHGDVSRLSLAELKAKHGFDAVRAAEYAAEDESIDSAAEWARTLEKLAVRTHVGNRLVKYGKRLIQGDNGVGDDLLSLAAKLDKGETGFTTMADIKALTAEETWIPSYYEPIDANAGGLPIGGLTIISGPAGLGKTTLLLDIFGRCSKEQKHVAFFSLEMSKELVTMRLKQIHRGIRKKDLQYIHVQDEVLSAPEVFAEAARLAAEYDLHMIGVDYADKLIRGAQSEEAMGAVYNEMATLSRVTGIPVVLIAGVSRGYVGGEPMVNHIRYSGRAEHDASLIILVHNPGLLEVDMGQDNKRGLQYIAGFGWLKFGKSRLGMKQGTLGAALVAWDDKTGKWGGKTTEWYAKLTG
jgi:replicative DNA helicase